MRASSSAEEEAFLAAHVAGAGLGPPTPISKSLRSVLLVALEPEDESPIVLAASAQGGASVAHQGVLGCCGRFAWAAKVGGICFPLFLAAKQLRWQPCRTRPMAARARHFAGQVGHLGRRACSGAARDA